MKKINIEYTAKIENYYEAEEYFRKSKKLRYKVDKLMEILLIILGIIMCFMQYYILGSLFLVIGIIFITNLSSRFITFLYYSIYIKKKGLEKLVLSDENLIYELKNIKSELSWEIYINFIEIPSSILLLYNKSRYAVIPKSSFENEELDSFIKFLNNKYC